MSTDGRAQEVLSEWQPRLRLVMISDPDDRCFVIDDLDDDHTAPTYPHDRFYDAVDDYNRRLFMSLDPQAAAPFGTILEMSNAMGSRNHDALATTLHDNYTFVDHRAIGWPNLDKQGLIDATVANEGTYSRFLSRDLHTATGSGVVVSGGFWTLNFGEWTEFQIGVFVSLTDGAQMLRTEIFPDGQVGAALAQFDLLTAS